ncbi:MAG TPA: hypothetical protein VGR71_03885, partial [Nitrospira sp.]|nr:hypothetical protein [Nitrospira sp.]
ITQTAQSSSVSFKYRGWRGERGDFLTRPPLPLRDAAVTRRAQRKGPTGDGWSEHGGAVRRDRTRETD